MESSESLTVDWCIPEQESSQTLSVESSLQSQNSLAAYCSLWKKNNRIKKVRDYYPFSMQVFAPFSIILPLLFMYT